MKTAADILTHVTNLVTGDRQNTHGDKLQNHENIARLWNAFLCNRNEAEGLKASEVALMMVLLKVARTQLGHYNADDLTDLIGYGSVAFECRERELESVTDSWVGNTH